MDMTDATVVAQTAAAHASARTAAAGELLTFKLGAEEYGMDTSRAWSTCVAWSCQSSTCA